MKLTGPASRLFERSRRCSRPGNLSLSFGEGLANMGAIAHPYRGLAVCRLPLIVVVFSLAFARADDPQSSVALSAPLPPRPDAQRVQGTWERTQLYNGASLISEAPGDVTLVIVGEVATFHRSGKEQSKWTIKFDAMTTPRRLDLVGLGDSKRRILLGIYRLEDDKLTYCNGEARPATFEGFADGVCLEVFRRKKP